MAAGGTAIITRRLRRVNRTRRAGPFQTQSTGIFAKVRARIRVMVRRILKKHAYPPDLQDEAVKTVLAQAELLCAGWV